MPRDLGLAKRLRAAGLDVVEVPGWKTRGSDSFFPRGAVTHHTAGAPDRPGQKTPSLRICTFGRPDLSGPLCNTYLGYDRKVYVVAAGRANHAGIPDGGSIKGMTGNSTAWGLEIEHPGTFPLPDDMAEIAARIQAATVKGTTSADKVVYHKEWAPSRKIDLATAPSPVTHRKRVAFYLNKNEQNTEENRKRLAVLRTWIRARLDEGMSWSEIKKTFNWREYKRRGGE